MRIGGLLLLSVLNLYGFQVAEKDFLENMIRAELTGEPMMTDIKCATRYHVAIYENSDQIEPGLYRDFVQSVMVQPVRQRSLVSPGGYIQLYWDDTGINQVPQADLSGNGYPDYIDSAAVIFDRVYKYQVETMGYRPPPKYSGGADIPYPIYFTAMVYYGVTTPIYQDIPWLPGTNYASYIEVENDYKGFPTPGLAGLKVTAAHEFHHAIQLGYIYKPEDFFFYEMTSTWMEEVLYPEINDYHFYLGDLFETVSNRSFDTWNGVYPYANSLYLQLLEKQFNRSIVKSIWDRLVSQSAMRAIRSTLQSKGGSWTETLNEYAVWLFYTGNRVKPGMYFDDASQFPKVAIDTLDQFIYTDGIETDVFNTRFSNRYFTYSPVLWRKLNIAVSSEGFSDGGFTYMTNISRNQFLPLNVSSVTNPIDGDTLFLVVSNGDSLHQQIYIRLMDENGDAPGESYAAPNPVVAGTNSVVRFQNIPPEAQLTIYNINGRKVADVGPYAGSLIRPWYLVNDNGQTVASGVYFFVVSGENIRQTGKFTVLR